MYGGFRGPPDGFMEALAQKYALMQQEQTSRAALQGAQTEQIGVQTQFAPMLATAQVEQMGAGSQLDIARAGLAREQGADLQFLRTPASADRVRMLDTLYGRRGTTFTGQPATRRGAASTAQPFTGTGTGWTQILAGSPEEKAMRAARGFKKGVARVPGKGDGTKDTVKAKLAPGEAVLNKSAAETLGRGLIDVLNKMGAKKMGLL